MFKLRPLRLQHYYYALSGESDADIALIRLDRPIRFNSHIKKVCLPDEYREGYFDGKTQCWITGWGDTLGGRILTVFSSVKIYFT